MIGSSEHESVSIGSPSSRTRREVIAALAGASAAAALGFVGHPAQAARGTAASSAELAAHAHDWDWLVGTWDVWHCRLKERLVGSDDWDEFAGRSVEWNTMSGLGTIDDHVLELPGGVYRALGIRAFDPATRRWSIWWLDGRNPTRIDPPVVGGFENDTARSPAGPDAYPGPRKSRVFSVQKQEPECGPPGEMRELHLQREQQRFRHHSQRHRNSRCPY